MLEGGAVMKEVPPWWTTASGRAAMWAKIPSPARSEFEARTRMERLSELLGSQPALDVHEMGQMLDLAIQERDASQQRIADAPHEYFCGTVIGRGCNCWKSDLG